MRKPCINCTLKHLAQAEILLTEAALGYPSHIYLAIGHLAEAEAEILGINIEVARNIRAARLGLDSGVPLPYEVLVNEILGVEDE